MKNPLADFVAYRIHDLVRKGTSEEALAKSMDIPLPRLRLLMDGTIPTKAEAQALMKVLGGRTLDYRPYTLADDEWWSSQPPAIQAEIQRITREATYAPEKLLEAETRYTKRNLAVILTAVVCIIGSLAFGLYKGSQVKALRKESRAWGIRNAGSRSLAYDEVAIEICKEQILFVQAVDPLVDRSWQTPAERAKARGILLDLAHYYKVIGFQSEEKAAKTRFLQGDPEKWSYNSVMTDPFTGQAYNLDSPDGGAIDIKLLKKLVAVDLRIENVRKMVEAVAGGKQDLDAIPPMDQWSEATKGDMPTSTWKKASPEPAKPNPAAPPR